MLPGHGIASGTVDGVVNKRPRRLFGISSERKNPINVQFERRVAHVESRQQHQRFYIVTVIPCNFYDFKPSRRTDGNSHQSSEPASPEDSLDLSSSLPPIFVIPLNVPDDSNKRWVNNSPRLLDKKSTVSNMSNSDFLVNSFTKTSVNAGHTTRRKSKKKSKKHKQRYRTQTDESEIKCRENNSPTPAIDMVDCEELTLSPKCVVDILFEDTFSPSSSVKEASEEAPDSENDNDHCSCSVTSVSTASYCDEAELSRSTTACLELFGLHSSSNNSCLGNNPNSTLVHSSQETCDCRSRDCRDNNKALLNFRNECGSDPCETTECCCSREVGDNCGSGICSQNGVGTCNGVQAVHLCSDTSSDSDFHLVISRKRARKEKKMSLWKSFNGEYASAATYGRNNKCVGHSSRQIIEELDTKDWSHRQNRVASIRPQHGVVLKNSTKNFIQKASNICKEVEPYSGIASKNTKPGRILLHYTSPKEDSSRKLNNNFKKEQNIDSDKKLPNVMHIAESDFCEMKSNSTSEHAASKFAKGNCSSESGRSTNCTVITLPMQERGLEASLKTNDANDINSGLLLPGSESAQVDLMVRYDAVPSVKWNGSLHKLRSAEIHLIEMFNIVNDAYEVQISADAHLAAGHPITDLETFIYSATPVVGHVPCMKSNNCSKDQLVNSSVCQQNFSNVSLRSIWEWYEEPGCYGLEVRGCNDLSSDKSFCSSSEFCAYFVPYLSAIQLFGWSRKSTDHSSGVGEGDLLEATNTASYMCSHPVPSRLHKPFEQSIMHLSESSLFVHDHGEIIFEYFETEQPSFRPPLFEKIKELASGVNVSGRQMFGDPEKLQNAKLCDLHPASWFCVAWYPVYRIPHGNFRAAFLTYHSIGKLVPQKGSPDLTGASTHIVSPVFGLQSYNDKGEQWFQLRCPDSKQMPRDGEPSQCTRAEVFKERLRTLQRGALATARAVIPKGTGESANYHPDYEFFRSRST
ncbi:hypothetical protein ABZP36_028569 [Zizania latifolia]